MNILCGLNEMVNFLMKTTKFNIYFPHNRCTFQILASSLGIIYKERTILKRI